MFSWKVVRSSILVLCAFLLGASPLAANMVCQSHAALRATPPSLAETASVSQPSVIKVISASSLESIPLAYPSSGMALENSHYVFVVTDPVTGAGVLTLAGGAALIDGPLPIGDIIGAGILIGGLIIIWSQTPEEAINDIKSPSAIRRQPRRLCSCRVS